MIKLNARVQHRAWNTEGIIVDFPIDFSYLSTVTVLRDDTNREEDWWIPAFKVIDEEEFEWDDEDPVT